jgi:uncharacterized membrane-anchored protein YjiN (DUF445 family)
MSEFQASPKTQKVAALLMADRNQTLIDRVIIQICEDVENGDVTAIEELLKNVSVTDLEAFLPED